MFIYDVVLLALRCAALVAGGIWLTAVQTVISYSVVGIATDAALIFWVWQIIRQYKGDMMSEGLVPIQEDNKLFVA